MPVPTDVRLNVQILLDTGGYLVAQYRPAVSAYLLPGGTVEPAEGIGTAAARYVRTLTGSPAASPEFVGCVEHLGPAAERTITALFATDLPDDADVPTTHLGAPLVPLALEDLNERSLTPPAVSTAVLRWLEDRWPVWQGLPVHEPEPWWNHLSQSVHSLRAQLHARRHELDDAAFRDAAVAICALVAAADGTIDARERDAMAHIVATDRTLSAFPPNDLVRLFDAHVAALRADPAAGRAVALREIAKVRGNRVRARSVVQFGAVIGRSDGTFDPDERAVVQEALDVLGLDPSSLAVQTVQWVRSTHE
ncbi:Tellurite resistance TerB [Candidatus Protofrankia californiensis]|uniref:Tellurite resistance TerB n=1 Tax=Candidatus Protofrankia californiensis TaxID=1839754 RepID=A0A1C3NWN1_9ACTN|nr:Tellurite resistance TerB [Candidatus Protofrankia californiensis]